MAELPSYKERGIGVQPYGRGFDYTNLQDELRRGKGLDTALDKLSEWAGKKMEDKAESEGQNWGAAHPITQEQLDAAYNEKDADKRNAALASLIQGDPSTVTGAAIAETQVAQLRSLLEIAGRKEMALLQAQGELGRKPDDLEGSLNALVSGYSATLATAGGVQGVKEAKALRASLTAASQPIFAATVKQEVDKLRAAANADLELGIKQVPLNMRPLFGALLSAGDPKAMEIAINNLSVQRNTVKNALVGIAINNNNVGALKGIDKAFLDATTEAFVRHLSDGNMADANKKLMTGGFDNAGMVGIWASLSTADRDHISGEVRKSFVATHEAEVTDAAANKARGLNEVNPFIAEYLNNPAEDSYQRLENLNASFGWPYTPSELRLIREKATRDADSNYPGRIRLIDEITKGKIPDGPALIERAGQLGVSLKDAFSAMSAVIASGRYLAATGNTAARDVSDAIGGTPQTQARNQIAAQAAIEAARASNAKLSPEKRRPDELIVGDAIQAFEEKKKTDAINKFRDELNREFNTTVNPNTALDEKSIEAILFSYRYRWKHDAAAAARLAGRLRMLRAKQEGK